MFFGGRGRTGWILLLPLLVSSGCSTVNVPTKVTHPAEINMGKYRQIALSSIEGNMSRQLTDQLKSRLIESGRFTLVDRSRFNDVMRELNLSNSDLAQSDKAARLGNLLPATAIIAGSIHGYYDESEGSSQGTCYRNKQKYACTYYTRNGKFTTSGSMDVIDVATGEIIKSKPMTYVCPGSTSAVDATPPSIDQSALAGECLDKGLTAFFKAITPWSEVVAIPFETDGDIPTLELGVNKAKIDDMAGAIEVFQEAIKTSEMNVKVKPKAIAKAYWNLGLAYQYSQQFGEAEAALKKAYLLQPSDRCMTQIQKCNVMKTEMAKLLEQL